MSNTIYDATMSTATFSISGSGLKVALTTKQLAIVKNEAQTSYNEKYTKLQDLIKLLPVYMAK